MSGKHDALDLSDVLGEEIDAMSDDELGETVAQSAETARRALVLAEVKRLEVKDDAREEFKRRQAAREAETMPEFDVGTLAEVLRRPADPPHRVDGLIPWAALTLVVAQRKTGKTTFCVNLARSLLRGEPFLGTFDVRPLHTGQSVALLNYEVSAQTVAGWAAKVSVPADGLVIVTLRGRRNPLASEVDRRELARRLRAHRVASVIVDPFSRAFTGDNMNDAGQVTRFLADLDRWVRQDVGAVDLVLTAHAGWEAERARNSSALEDAPDSIITLTSGARSGDADGRYLRAIGRDIEVEEDRLAFDPVTPAPDDEWKGLTTPDWRRTVSRAPRARSSGPRAGAPGGQPARSGSRDRGQTRARTQSRENRRGTEPDPPRENGQARRLGAPTGRGRGAAANRRGDNLAPHRPNVARGDPRRTSPARPYRGRGRGRRTTWGRPEYMQPGRARQHAVDRGRSERVGAGMSDEFSEPAETAGSRTPRAHPLDDAEEIEPMTDCGIERVKVRRLWSPRLPEGFDLYRVGCRRNDPRYLVAPVLADDAPEPVVEAFLDDLRAQALGECPTCGGVPRLTREPPAPGEPGRAAWEVLPLYVSVRHAPTCPVVTLADHVHRWRLPSRSGPEEVPD